MWKHQDFYQLNVSKSCIANTMKTLSVSSQKRIFFFLYDYNKKEDFLYWLIAWTRFITNITFTGALSKMLRKIHKKTPVVEFLFDKVAGMQSAAILTKKHGGRCFPINSARFLKTAYYRAPLGDSLCLSDT